MSKPTIGLAMIMQNEEVHIPISIAQFYSAVSDIVVVDGGSKDASVMWAERMGARVFRRPFDNHFSDQKNFAIEQLDTDWVYVHDPDERLEPTLVDVFPFLVSVEGQRFLAEAGFLPESEDPFDCIGIPRKNLTDGVKVLPYPDYQYRLFARYCRFEGAVHEKVVNFTNRGELNCSSTESDQESPIGQFNILHFKSSARQRAKEELYKTLVGRE